jgi:Tfp pilus assembly protein PilF
VGLAQLCIGDGDGAARSFQRSLQIDPNQPEIRRALGQIGG